MSQVTAAPSGATGAGHGPVGSLLERFRRTAGVPAAAAEDIEAELVPVFAALAALEAEAAAELAAAHEEAQRRVAAAEREAERIRLRAAVEAEGQRTRAETERREAAAARASELEALSREAAEAELAEGRERIPALAHELAAELFGGKPKVEP